MATEDGTTTARSISPLLAAILLASAYALAAVLGLQWAAYSGAASPIWPAAGLGIAGLLLGGKRLWPAIALGAFVAMQATSAEHPLWSQLVVAFGNAGAAVAAALLAERFGKPRFRQLATLRDLLVLCAAAALAAALAALIGALSLISAGAISPALLTPVLQTWFLGDFVGILTVSALLLTLASRTHRFSRFEKLHLAAALLFCGILSAMIFLGPHVARAWAVYPALGYVALLFRVRGASLAVMVVSVVASIATIGGSGPFAPAAVPDLLLLQQYLAITAAATLLLAAAVDERDSEAGLREARERELAARDELARVHAMLRLVTESAPIAIFAKDFEGRYIYANAPVAAATRTQVGELIGKTDSFWAPPEIAAALRENDDLAMKAQAPVEVEEEVPTGSGTVRTWRGLKAPLRATSGEIIGIAGVSFDITERKVAELELTRLAERAELAQRAARSSLYEYDPAADRAERDPLIATIAGYPDLEPTLNAWEKVIHPEDLAGFRSLVERAIASSERFAIEYRIVTASGETMWIADAGRIVRNADGQVTRIVGLVADVTQRKRQEEELARHTAELETLLTSAPIGLAYFSRDGRFLRINEELAAANRRPVEVHLGRRVDAILGPDGKLIREVIEDVFDSGEPRTGIEFEHVLPGEPAQLRHWLTGYFPVRDAHGTMLSVGCWVIEITERKLAEERERLLAREVDHRAKNLLAVIQSVVQLSRANDTPTFRASVVGRIQSLARAHSLLAASRWEGVSLLELAVEELSPYGLDQAGRVTIEGPPLQLRPAAAQSLALALHELATNAAKYGALRSPGGRLEVRWERAEHGSFQLYWRERGTGPTSPPQHRGFGDRVITASIERQLGGSMKRLWGDDGLEISLILPPGHLSEHQVDEPAAPLPPEAKETSLPASAAPAQGTGIRRLLVVEDEALIGLEVEQSLTERGFELIGIAATIPDAMRMADGSPPDVALLDINLDGEESFPLARAMVGRGIPVVFCTGYDGDSLIPSDLSHLPVVRKPFDPDDVVRALHLCLAKSVPPQTAQTPATVIH